MISTNSLMRSTLLQRPRSLFETSYNFASQPNKKQTQFSTKITNQTQTSQSASFRISTPLSSRLLYLPSQITQFCNRHNLQYQPYNFDCERQFFWLAIQTTFFLWRYKHISQWGPLPPDPQLILSANLNEPIVMAKIGKIKGYQYSEQSCFDILAIALTHKIIFFGYDENGQLFENMKMEIGTNGEVVEDMIFENGNIYYCGNQGSLKTVFNKPGFFRKQTKLTMKSSSLISDTVLNSMLLWKLEISSSHLTVVGDYAYTIIHKKYPKSWIAKKLIYKNQSSQQNFLRVFDIKTNIMLRQIQESVLFQKAKFKLGNKTEFARKIKMIGLFKRNGRLGVSFSSGMFAYLSQEGLMVQSAYLIPLIQPRNIVAQRIMKQLDIVGIGDSLGFENISLFQNIGIAYANEKELDICYAMRQKEVIQVRQLPKSQHHYNNTMFQQPRQWMCINPGGIIQTRRLRLQQIIIVYLQILRWERFKNKQTRILQPFNHLCRLYGVVEICSNLMDIICSANFQFQISEQTFQNTRTQIFKIATRDQIIQPNKNSTQPFSIQNRTIKSDHEIVKTATEILNYITSRDLSSELDTLWRAILSYFNEIYNLIKNKTPSECIKNYEVIQLAKSKLEEFRKLMHLKSLEFNVKDWKDSDETLSLGGQKLSDKIPPMRENFRQKYDICTPVLIVKTKDMIDKIHCLLEAISLLKYNGEEGNQPTIHEILTRNNTRNALRCRIFKDIDSNHPVMLQMIKVFPELLNYSDRIFNEFILNPKSKNNTFSIEDLVPTLKNERIPVVRQFFYKEDRMHDFIVLLLQRMKLLQVEKHKTKQPFRTKHFLFAQYELGDKKEKLEELESNWRVVVKEFELGLRDYVNDVLKSKNEDNKLELLARYIRSQDIEPITEFAQTIFEEEGLNDLAIQMTNKVPEKINLKPRVLYFKNYQK